MASVSLSKQMAIITKVNGKTIRETDKVSKHMLMAMYMMAYGLMDKCMDKAL